ncbi:hypothetical protein BY458DRAFT_494056 [Sporodiniella umbellata]|nr:hypothetical protein BY458DRAFT_494056 [Sporodiniella umbellata]
MLACRSIVRWPVQRASRIHTSAIVLGENGLFGKFNPWAAKENKEVVTPAQQTSEALPVTFNVNYEDKISIPSWKNKEVIKDQEKIESILQSIVLEHSQEEGHWKEFSLNDRELKFKIIKESMKQLGREIPSYQLNTIEKAQDILDSFVEFNKNDVEAMTIRDFLESREQPANVAFVPRA